jgi:UDP-N-acetylglucosamine--N-acetylmuramyl-(pentapeptide) pyrophosphoryl-undecaprenol N-acetylglucosamine transferase
MRVVVSGGGSGGHIFPALAVAESLRRLRPDTELLFVGGTTGMETQIVPARGMPFQAVTARKLRKVLSPSTLLVGLSLLKGFREARAHLRAFRAEAVVGTGGYVAAAAVLAGVSLRLPTVIVAPDFLPGRTNRLLARQARRICVMFEGTVGQFPADRTVVTGMPLRAGVVLPPEVTKAETRCRFSGLRAAPFTILVMGGSQGAQALNERILTAAPALLDAGAQILHQTGTRNIDAVRAEAGHLIARGGYYPLGFLDDAQIPAALRAADVVVCRGGISTLAENLVNGLPAIVVPLPTAYADHQTVNARALVTAGAAALLPQSELTPERIVADLLALRDDAGRQQRMTEACLRLGRRDAADAVAGEVIKLIA